MGNTVPGGYYLGVDGKPHDAWGLPLDKQSEKALEATKKEVDDDPQAAARLSEKLTAEREAQERQKAADEAAARAREAAKASKSAHK